MVPPKEVEARKRSRQETSTTTISGFSLDFGVRLAAFRDLGAYGKETCKMSKNKVVHHNEPYRQLLAWSLLQTDNRPYYDSEDGQVISLRNFAHRHYRKLHLVPLIPCFHCADCIMLFDEELRRQSALLQFV